MKILAGVDGSRKSLEAIRFVSQVLDPENDSFTFYFRPPEIHIAREDVLVPAIPAELRAQLIEDVFEKSREFLPIPFHDRLYTIIGEKKPAAGLLLAAEQSSADLILVGADTKHGHLGTFLGGVARHVAREASVPVFVYRDAAYAKDREDSFRVLLAHDGSPAATQAGQMLGQFRWPSHAVGTMVQIMEWIDIRMAGEPEAPSVWRSDYERYVENAKTKALQELLAARDQMPALFQGQAPIVETGPKVQKICDSATAQKSDVIVVGPHNRGLLRRVFGATTESLLHYAPCSVLVSHQPENP